MEVKKTRKSWKIILYQGQHTVMRLVLVSSRKFGVPDQDGNRLQYNATIICWHNMLRYAICCAVMTIPAIWLYKAQWVQNINVVLYQLYTMKFSVYHSLIRNLFSSLFFSIARNLFNFEGNHVTPDPGSYNNDVTWRTYDCESLFVSITYDLLRFFFTFFWNIRIKSPVWCLSVFRICPGI